MFPEQRRMCYNKQTKPPLYMCGNLLVTRTRAVLEHRELFGARSLALVIPPAYAADVDTSPDVEWTEWLVSTGKVALTHLEAPAVRSVSSFSSSSRTDGTLA